MINDPHLDATCDMAAGLHPARAPLLDLAILGLPTSCERVDLRSTLNLVDHVVRRHLTTNLLMPTNFKSAPNEARAVMLELLPSAIQGGRSWTW